MKKFSSLLLVCAMLLTVMCASVVSAGAVSKDMVITRSDLSDTWNGDYHTLYTYDKNGNVTREAFYESSDSEDVLNYCIDWAYDDAGNCTYASYSYYFQGEVGMVSSCTNTYNDAGLLTKTVTTDTYPDYPDDSSVTETVNTYNSDGTLKQEKTTRDGGDSYDTTDYTYEAGVLTEAFTTSADGTQSKWVYTTVGNTTTAVSSYFTDTEWRDDYQDVTVDNGNSIVYTHYRIVYDGLDRSEYIDTVTTDTFNAQGNILSSVVTESDSKVQSEVEYTYDADGSITEMVETYYDTDPARVRTTTYTYGSRSEAVSLTMLNGSDQTWTPGSGVSLTFRSEAPLGEFLNVTVDGQIIDKANYDLTEGSTIVALHADYLATLSGGDHEIGIVSTSGTARASFAVDTTGALGDTPDTTSSPATADSSNLVLLFALTGFAALGVVVCRKKFAK